MPGLLHYHFYFHFKIGLQNKAQSMTHLSVQHNNILCLSHSDTHTYNNNTARSLDQVHAQVVTSSYIMWCINGLDA